MNITSSKFIFDSNCEQKKVVLILDAEIGPTKVDLEVLLGLKERCEQNRQNKKIGVGELINDIIGGLK